MNVLGYDAWKTDPREPVGIKVCTCAGCEEDIYVDDDIKELDTGEIIHNEYECVLDFLKKCLGAIDRTATRDDAA